MKLLTEEECGSLCESYGWRVANEANKLRFLPSCKVTEFTVPTEAARLVALADAFAELFQLSSNCLFWITDWQSELRSVWALLEILRKADTDTRALIDAPGHLFRGSLEGCRSLALLCLIARWDFWLFDFGSESVLSFDHHLRGIILDASPSVRNAIVDALQQFQIEVEMHERP